MEPTIRAILAMLACAAALPAAAQPTPPGALTLTFIALDGSMLTSPGQALVDAGPAKAHQAGRSSHVVVQRRVGLRLEGPYARARVSVRLESEMPGSVVRVNGRRVGPMPQLVDPAHRVGATVAHEVEITIDADVPPGPFLRNLQWLAETD